PDQRDGGPDAGAARRQCRVSEGHAESQRRPARGEADAGGIAQPARLIRSSNLQSRADGLGAALYHCISEILIPVGPRMTTNSTGRKNRIIGTVSFGGSAAAFFSASFMRMSRFSCAMTRKECPSGVP